MPILFKQTPHSFLILLTIFSLSACSGGGDGGDGNNNNADLTVKTGIFNDSIVTGLGYKTKTQLGVTDAAGKFNYIEGEEVTFFVGDTIVGTAKAQAIITPLNLVPNVKTYTLYKDFKHMIRNPDTEAYKNFSHLTNILVFLQSLDKDGDPSNGITISPEVTTLFKSKNINLNFDIDDIPRYSKLTDITILAASKNYLTTGRLKSLGQALDHFYSSQKIETQFSLTKDILDDTKGDGSKVNRISYDYYVDGLKSQESTDSGNNNANVRTKKYTYDDYDNMLTKTTDSDGDGDLDSTQTSTYGKDGYITKYITTKANGMLASSYNFTYENGHLIKSEQDSDGDGNPNKMILTSYNADGLRIEKKVDTNGDGTAESITTYDYDTNQYLIEEAFDTDANNSPNRIKTYKYDSRGNQIFIGDDSDGDGTDEIIITSKFDDKNNQISDAIDNNADGMDEQINTYSYNANGFLIKKSYDTNANGTANRILTYDVDTNGNTLKQSDDTDADGDADSIVKYDYDANNNQTLVEIDSDADDVADVREITEYDSNSNKTLYTKQNQADGVSNRIITYTYKKVSWVGVFGSL